MIVTFGNTKGGVGKSTLALNFGIARVLSGRDVWLIDADRQGTTQTAISIRADREDLPGVACSSYTEGPTLRAQLKQQAPRFSDVVIDAGGRDSSALRAALTLTDIVIVPFIPRSVDVWALRDMAALIDEARSVRDGLKAYAVLNCADPGQSSTDNEEAAAAVADFPQLEYLPTPIKRRKAFANATGSGLCVLEYKPADNKAQEEFKAFVSVFN